MSYKKIGKYIRVVNIRNKELEVKTLLGVSVKKVFIPSIANTVGTDFKKYKIVKKHQFVYIPDTSRRGDKIGIAMLDTYEKALVSQAYTVFEIIDGEKLDSEYLMMWFRRPEFDRYARFKSHGSVREIFDWDEVCNIELPIPSIEKQRAIVKEYNTVVNRITLNETLNQKLEETAQALYKHWFVDFEFPFDFTQGKPNKDGKPYKSSGGEMVYNEELDKEIPVGWSNGKLDYFLEIKYGKDYKHLSDGDIPLYGSGGIMKFVNQFLYNKPSILIPRKGTLSNIIYIDEPFWSVDTMFFSKIKNEDYGFYTFYFLKTIDFYALNVGSAVPSTTTNMLNSLNLVKPSKSILKEFNQKLNGLYLSRKDRVLLNEKLEQIKSLLLSKMTKVEEEKEMVK